MKTLFCCALLLFSVTAHTSPLNLPKSVPVKVDESIGNIGITDKKPIRSEIADKAFQAPQIGYIRFPTIRRQSSHHYKPVEIYVLGKNFVRPDDTHNNWAFYLEGDFSTMLLNESSDAKRLEIPAISWRPNQVTLRLPAWGEFFYYFPMGLEERQAHKTCFDNCMKEQKKGQFKEAFLKRQCEQTCDQDNQEDRVFELTLYDKDSNKPLTPPFEIRYTVEQATYRGNGDGIDRDRDGDGFEDIAYGGEDCDDTDADRYPGNVEVPDPEGKDEDCDPYTTGARDLDRDGFRDSRPFNINSPGLAEGRDCDDEDAAVNPTSPEVCNGKDDNCDGEIDEGVLWTYYKDKDGDLFGDPTQIIKSCPGLISGDDRLVTNNNDCNDNDPTVNPRNGNCPSQ